MQASYKITVLMYIHRNSWWPEYIEVAELLNNNVQVGDYTDVWSYPGFTGEKCRYIYWGYPYSARSIVQTAIAREEDIKKYLTIDQNDSNL